MTSTFDFTAWPPELTDEQRADLTRLATTYALAHGLLYLPPSSSPDGTQPSAPTSAIHAPLALFPAPFPRDLVEDVQRLQGVYNVLYARIALDREFLDEVMGAETGAGRVDEFTGQLWRSWKRLRDEAVPEVRSSSYFYNACERCFKFLCSLCIWASSALITSYMRRKTRRTRSRLSKSSSTRSPRRSVHYPSERRVYTSRSISHESKEDSYSCNF